MKLSFNRFIFCFFFCFSAVFGYGQKVDLVSITDVIPKGHTFHSLHGTPSTGIILVTEIELKTIGIHILDEKGNVISSHLEPFVQTKYNRFEEAIYVNGRFYLTYSDYDKVQLTEMLVVREVNLKGDMSVGEPRTVLRVKGKTPANASHQKFHVYRIKNENVICVLFSNKKIEPGQPNYYIFDTDFSTVIASSKIDYIRDFRDEKFDSRYSFMRLLPEGESDYKFYFLDFTNEGKRHEFPTQQLIELTKNTDASSIVLKRHYDAKSDKIVIYGELREKNTKQSIAYGSIRVEESSTLGFFKLIMNTEDFSIESGYYQPFDSKTIKELTADYMSIESEYIKKLPRKGVPGLISKKIHPASDGGTHFVFQLGVSYAICNENSCINYTVTKSILWIKVNANGEIEKMNKIPYEKRLYSPGVYGPNFLFFNDNLIVIDYELENNVLGRSALSAGNLGYFTVSPSGKVSSRSELYSFKKLMSLRMRFKETTQAGFFVPTEIDRFSEQKQIFFVNVK